jgi:hypothetical protein
VSERFDWYWIIKTTMSRRGGDLLDCRQDWLYCRNIPPAAAEAIYYRQLTEAAQAV